MTDPRPAGEHPLASARRKLSRAERLIDAVRGAVGEYVASRPDRLVREVDPLTGDHLVYATITRPPNEDIAVVLGDAVHNLRAALDHAIFGLSVDHARRALTATEERSVWYPVCRRPVHWEAATKGPLRFLSADLQTVVDMDQPYHAPAGLARGNNPLAVLDDLCNIDKHRSLLLVGAVVELQGVGLAENVRGRHGFRPPPEPGATLVVRLPPDADPEHDIEVYSRVQVQFAPGGPVRNPVALGLSVENVLDSLWRAVEWRLSALETSYRRDRTEPPPSRA